jgi:hypothetical protein
MPPFQSKPQRDSLPPLGDSLRTTGDSPSSSKSSPGHRGILPNTTAYGLRARHPQYLTVIQWVKFSFNGERGITRRERISYLNLPVMPMIFD